MSKKSPKISALIERCQGHLVDAHYLGFFECFNRQLFYEAHDVLEELWLEDRHGSDGAFYKGLIQLAGAFVHLQKGRPGPATALLMLARANLVKYGNVHQHLEVAHALVLIGQWLTRLQNRECEAVRLADENAPKLGLLESAFSRE